MKSNKKDLTDGQKEAMRFPVLIRQVENGYLAVDFRLETNSLRVWVAETQDKLYDILEELGVTSVAVLTDEMLAGVFAQVIQWKKIAESKESKS